MVIHQPRGTFHMTFWSIYCHSTFLGIKVLRNIKIKIKNKKIKNNTKIVYCECLLRHVVLCVLWLPMCLYLYGPFCHGALKLDLSTLITACLEHFLLLTLFMFTRLHASLNDFGHMRFGLLVLNKLACFVSSFHAFIHIS